MKVGVFGRSERGSFAPIRLIDSVNFRPLKGRLRKGACAEAECPLLGVKRTWRGPDAMSALCHKRTSAASFDHLVGAREHRCRYIEAERLRGLKIEDKLILRRRLNRSSPLNQANFFNCTVSAEQPVPAAGGGD